MVRAARDSDSKIIKHARFELERAGLFDKNNPLHGGHIGRGTLAMVNSLMDWSKGDKAMMETMIMSINQIVSGELLSPPTTDPGEWEPVEGATPGTVRNKRSPMYVSEDNGKHWMHLGSKEKGSSQDITEVRYGVPEQQPKTTDGRSAETNKESDSPAPSGKGRRRDVGLDSQGVEDSPQPESPADKPEAREDS